MVETEKVERTFSLSEPRTIIGAFRDELIEMMHELEMVCGDNPEQKKQCKYKLTLEKVTE